MTAIASARAVGAGQCGICGRPVGAYGRHIPDEVRARVTGAFQAVNYGTRPLGALAAGGLATLIGLRPTLWLTAGGATLGFLWLLPSPLPWFRMPGTSAAIPASAPSS